MKSQTVIVLLFSLFFGKAVAAQSFEGVWKGTSICQVKNSPCHDEIVVYYISRGVINDSYDVIANKIVNGKEDSMGTISFMYDAQKKVFISVDNVRSAKWEFKVTDKTMKGTLMYKGELYRIIDAKREN